MILQKCLLQWKLLFKCLGTFLKERLRILTFISFPQLKIISKLFRALHKLNWKHYFSLKVKIKLNKNAIIVGVGVIKQHEWHIQTSDTNTFCFSKTLNALSNRFIWSIVQIMFNSFYSFLKRVIKQFFKAAF